MKQLNIIEAMQMPIGTEFEVIFDGERISGNTMMISLDFIGTREYKNIDWKCHPKDSFMRPFEFLINGKFIPIQQPVSFIEAVNSGRKIKCVHARFSSSNIYMSIEEMFYKFTLGADDFPIVLINEGKWFIEE